MHRMTLLFKIYIPYNSKFSFNIKMFENKCCHWKEGPLYLSAGFIFPGPEDEFFFMLNSAEQDILNAYKYTNIQKFHFFQAQESTECYFSCS